MKKIFLISEYILPTQNTTGYLFHKLHKNLKQQYGDNLKILVKEDPVHKLEDAILVADVNLNKKKLIQRLFFELIISFKFFSKILQNVGKGDVVFTGTTPILLLPIVYIAKKIKKFNWILLVHDVFPENLIAANVLKPNNFFYKILKFFFDKFYAAADKRIVIGKDMKELIDDKVERSDSIIIQNWIDHHDIEVQEKNNILNTLNWQSEQPIFYFFGNIGRVQGIHNILQSLEILPIGKRPRVLFIGGGAYENELIDGINRINDENIKYIGSLDPSKKSEGLNAGDVAIVTLAEGMYGLGVPSKAYYSMAADKPLLAIMEAESEVSSMIKQHNIGWTVPTGDPQVLANLFLEISQNFNAKKLSSSRKVLIENYSEQIAMEKIVNIIEEVRLSK
ncbi:MAG: glycosyltransferase family 4 protein [Acinetobacter sp.]